MKAIVLTCDRYHALARHMIARYDALWPGHPFRFLVPYQERCPSGWSGAEYRQTPGDVKSTVLALLDGLPDNEWIYWCMDDKYPVRLDIPKIDAILAWIPAIADPGISGILMCRCRHLLRPEYLTGGWLTGPAGERYLERNSYQQIWIHQFLRVKVLRHLFGALPPGFPAPARLDFFKDGLVKPSGHRLFVRQRCLAEFGESTAGGILTRNCYDSLLLHKLPLPGWFSGTTGRRVFLGRLNHPGPLAELKMRVTRNTWYRRLLRPRPARRRSS